MIMIKMMVTHLSEIQGTCHGDDGDGDGDDVEEEEA